MAVIEIRAYEEPRSGLSGTRREANYRPEQILVKVIAILLSPVRQITFPCMGGLNWSTQH